MKYAAMLANPGGAEAVPAPDELVEKISVVKQHQETILPVMLDTEGNQYAGVLHIGHPSCEIAILSPVAKGDYQIACLQPALGDVLQDARISSLGTTTAAPTSNGRLRAERMYLPRELLLNEEYKVPVGTGFSDPESAEELNFINILQPSPLVLNGEETGDMVYPCVETLSSSVEARINISSVGASPSFTLTFTCYDSTGASLGDKTTAYAGSATTGVVTEQVSKIAPLSGTYAVGNFTLKRTTSSGGTLHALDIIMNYAADYTPLVQGLTPYAHFAGRPCHDYGALANIANSARRIAGSVRLTSVNSKLYSAGTIVARTMVERCPPAEAGAGAYQSLAEVPGTFSGLVETGMYAVLPPGDYQARSFRETTSVPQFLAPYTCSFVRMNVPLSGVPALNVRCITDTVFEIKTTSQLVVHQISMADAEVFQAVVNALPDESMIGDNPDHLKRARRFFTSALAGVRSILPALSLVPDPRAQAVAASLSKGSQYAGMLGL